MKEIILVLASTPNGEIGSKNTLPWRLTGDLPRFKKMTLGHTVIMGRKTYESLPAPLLNRTIIVITRQLEKHVPEEGIFIAPNLNAAIELGKIFNSDKIFIAGGGMVYEETLKNNLADSVELTTVYKKPKTPYDTVIDNFSLDGFVLETPVQHVVELDKEKQLWVISHTYSRYIRKH